jgi:hypothetical protein
MNENRNFYSSTTILLQAISLPKFPEFNAKSIKNEMYKTTRSFFMLTALLVLFSTPAGTALAGKQAKWTVMVYMSGDNNLENYVVKDIEEELGLVGSNKDIKILALADRGPGYDTSRGDWQTTKLFKVKQGMKANSSAAVADWGERDVGDPQTLIEFVTWSKTNYPADHYALYFWGHSWNWEPGWTMRDYTTNQDTLDYDTLDYDEIKAAIPSLGFIDMVGFDGCNMASIEIYKLWQGHATAVAASEDYVNWNGIEYDVVLSQLVANPNMTAEDVAVASAQSAIDGGEETYSAVAVNDERLYMLLTAVDEFAVALNNGLAENRKLYRRAFSETSHMWKAKMDKDLYDMAYEINRLVSDSNIKFWSNAVMDAIDSVVLWEGHANDHKDVYGITINHISKATVNDQDYDYYRSTVDFALESEWDEFLDAYARVVDGMNPTQ